MKHSHVVLVTFFRVPSVLCRATNPSPSEGLTRAGRFVVAVPSGTLLLDCDSSGLLTQKSVSRSIPEIISIFKVSVTPLPCLAQVYLWVPLQFLSLLDWVGGWSFLLCHAITTIRRWVTSRIDSRVPKGFLKTWQKHFTKRHFKWLAKPWIVEGCSRWYLEWISNLIPYFPGTVDTHSCLS